MQQADTAAINLVVAGREEFDRSRENTMPAYRIEACDQFDFLSPSYADLFARSGATAFQHPEWLAALYENLAPACGAEALVVAVYARSSDQLVMVLPLLRSWIMGLHVVEYASLGVSDYSRPVCSNETFDRLAADPAFKDDLRRALAPFDIVRIKHIPAQGQHLAQLFDGSLVEPMPFSSYSLAMDVPFEQWQSTKLEKKMRKKIAKRRRALAQLGHLETAILDSPGQIETAFEKMRAFRQPRYADRGGEDLTQHAAFFDFYLDMATRGQKGGFAKTFALKLDDELIAVVFGLRHDKTFLYLLLGVDFANHARYSPGFLIYEDAIRMSLDEGEKVFDFTIGDEPFKKSFGTDANAIDEMWQSGSIKGRAALSAMQHFKWLKPFVGRLLRRT